MLLSAILLFLAAIAVHLAWPLIKRAAVLGLGLTVLAVVVRGMLLLEPRAAEADWLVPMVMGAIGMGAVFIICRNQINNLFVNARRRSAHERVDKEHDGYLR